MQTIGHFACDGDRVGHRQLLLAIQPIAQRLAFDVRHGEPQPAVHGPGVEDTEDVWMLQPRGELDLLLEAIGAEARGNLVVQHLERDGPVVSEVVREVDDGEAAASELALEAVPIGECRFENLLVGQAGGMREISRAGNGSTNVASASRYPYPACATASDSRTARI